jgi:hypothetical protein
VVTAGAEILPQLEAQADSLPNEHAAPFEARIHHRVFELYVVNSLRSLFENQLPNVRDIEHLCLAREQLLPALIKECFLLNEKLYRRMSYVAMICWHFTKDLKKWVLSVANPITDKRGRRELAKPVLGNFPEFINRASELM